MMDGIYSSNIVDEATIVKEDAEATEKPLYAAVADTMITKRADGKANVNGIPAGKTIRGVIYAKVTDKETEQTKWVYSEEVRLTNN